MSVRPHMSGEAPGIQMFVRFVRQITGNGLVGTRSHPTAIRAKENAAPTVIVGAIPKWFSLESWLRRYSLVDGISLNRAPKHLHYCSLTGS